MRSTLWSALAVHPEPFEPEVHDRISQKPERVHFADKMPRYRKSSKPR